MQLLLLISSFTLVASDLSHLQNQEEYNSKPYAFSYTAGRYPGHTDRQHSEVSDGSGVIRGQYSYTDPRHKTQTVQYMADRQDFHPVLNEAPPDHPLDTEEVARAKNQHYYLYNKIAAEHQGHPNYYGYNDATGSRTRRYQSVAPGALVENGAYVSPGAMVMGGAVIRQGAYVHDGALVKGGALVGPYAEVGNYAEVGAGAVLRERSRLRDGSSLADGQVLGEGQVR